MPTVSIVHVEADRVEEAMRRAVGLAGGFPDASGAKVLIKPNIVGPSPSGSGKITDARVTEAVVRLVLEHHPARVIVGEGSSVGYDFPGRVTRPSRSVRIVPFQAAARAQFGGATIVEKEACTGCMGEMVSTFIYLNRAGFGDRLGDLTLVLGTPDEVPATEIPPVIVGRCARAFRECGAFVPGCPPHGFAITDAACQVLGIDEQKVHRAIEELHDF